VKRKLQEKKKKKNPLRKFTVKGLAEAFADLNKILKKSENMDPNTERLSLIERNAHGALSVRSQSMMKKDTNQANHHGHISKKE
jgi:hypothetical protein